MTPDALVWGLLLGIGATLHCAGMCGAIGCALLVATGTSPATRPAWQRLAAMQLGRILSYALLGLAFGTFGAGLYRALDFSSVHTILQWLAAAIVVWTGFATAGLVPSFAGMDRALAPLAARTAQLRLFLSQSGPELDILSGLVWGLTPCPLVYIAIFNAMLLGSVEQSMAMMTTFGLVTSIPVMFAGLSLYKASGLRSRPGRALAGLAVAGAGLLAVALTTPGSPLCIT
jgi:sulfite exporter TauE/SafE